MMWRFGRLLRALVRHHKLGRAGEACGGAGAWSPLVKSIKKQNEILIYQLLLLNNVKRLITLTYTYTC